MPSTAENHFDPTQRLHDNRKQDCQDGECSDLTEQSHTEEPRRVNGARKTNYLTLTTNEGSKSAIHGSKHAAPRRGFAAFQKPTNPAGANCTNPRSTNWATAKFPQSVDRSLVQKGVGWEHASHVTCTRLPISNLRVTRTAYSTSSRRFGLWLRPGAFCTVVIWASRGAVSETDLGTRGSWLEMRHSVWVAN